MVRDQASILDPGEIGDDIYRQVVDWYRSTGGNASDGAIGLAAIMPYLQIQAVGDGVAHYLYCGTKSPAGHLYGRDFCRTAAGKSGIPDMDADRILTETYFSVKRERRPALERVAMPVRAHGVPHFCDFYRFIFPFNLNGISAVAALARFAGTPVPLN